MLCRFDSMLLLSKLSHNLVSAIFYTFSLLSTCKKKKRKNNSSFLFTAMSFWNTKPGEPACSAPNASILGRPWLPTPSPPHSPFPRLLQDGSKHLLTSPEQHTDWLGPRAIYTTHHLQFPMLLAMSKPICSYSSTYLACGPSFLQVIANCGT